MIIIMMGGMGASQKPIQAGQQKANELESSQSLSVLSISSSCSGPGSDRWGNLLDANSAGMAGSAEEFTKQFMSQLTGNTAGNLPPPL